MFINTGKVKFLKFKNKAEIFFRKAKSFFRAALFAEVYNQIVDEGSGVYGLAASKSSGALRSKPSVLPTISRSSL